MELGQLAFLEEDGLMMMDEIDWENLFDDAAPSMEEEKATGAVDSWIGEIEELLMNDDGDEKEPTEQVMNNEFVMSDLLLLDLPLEEPEVVVASSACSNSDGNVVDSNNNNNNHNNNGNGNSNSNSPNSDVAALEELNDSKEDDTDDDPLSKKRKRQLRNRDAAMRSRERKRMYVKDLEMKSRYMEAECRRLGRLLQCCYAENQMLRISLQSGSTFGASMAKPESAVLLLESLLLGSLVWLMAVMCLLLPQPTRPHPLSQGAVPSTVTEDVESAAPTTLRKGMRVKLTEPWLPLCFSRSKRCRASRIKMKPLFHLILLLV